MQFLSQFTGGIRRIASVLGPSAVTPFLVNTSILGASPIVPAAWVAATPQNLVNRAGRGELRWLCVRAGNATGKDIQVRIIADGTVVYNRTFNTNAAGRGHLPNGSVQYNNDGGGTVWLSPVIGVPIPYRATLVVEVTNSISEAAVGIEYYEVAQVEL